MTRSGLCINVASERDLVWTSDERRTHVLYRCFFEQVDEPFADSFIMMIGTFIELAFAFVDTRVAR